MHGILLLDKPVGGSSNHALQRAKRLYNARKAGHTGSLDPLASGMLPVCFGEATKLSGYLLNADKGYQTQMTLGVTTDSGDADGQVVSCLPVPELDEIRFDEICAQFTGPLLQVPPMVSAIKINGRRLYQLAREGKTVPREPRSVVIHALQVQAFDGLSATLAVRCSKGTYIRSLVTDIGAALGCGAHVTSLRRTFVSPFEDAPMQTFDTLETLANLEQLDAQLLPVDAGLDHLPKAIVQIDKVAAFQLGQSVSNSAQVESVGEQHSCRVYSSAGLFLGLGEPTPDGRIAPRRVLQWN